MHHSRSDAHSKQQPRERESGTKRKSAGGSQDNQTSKRVRRSYANAIKLLVGRDQDEYSVPKDLLCSSSEFFNAACSHRWLEHHQNTVEVPLVQPRVFEAYLHFLYTAELDLDVDALSCDRSDDRNPSATEIKNLRGLELTSLYLAGDMLIDGHFKHVIIDEILRLADNKKVSFGWESIANTWANTPATSGMRRLLVEYRATVGCTKAFYESGYAGLPKGFLAQLSFVKDRLLREAVHDDAVVSKTKPTFERRKAYYDGAEKGEEEEDYYVLKIDETS